MRRKTLGSDGPQRLERIEFFSGLTPAERKSLARMLDELAAEPGEELMHEGDYGCETVFVEAGSAEVRKGGAVINDVGAGELLGEPAVLDPGGRRTASVIAVTPLRGLALTSNSIHHMREWMPDLAEAIDRAADAHRERDRLRRTGQLTD
jgi:CRP/FNR family cyclic AMP-dependent transcriptional regulator